MKKSDLVETLAKESHISKAKAEKVVELFFDKMSDALAKGNRVEIRGFCSIFVKEYDGYTGRNPLMNIHLNRGKYVLSGQGTQIQSLEY